MLISLPWVNEIVDITQISLDKLIKRLTLSGFEVEEIIEMKNNNTKTTTLNISATANRSDSLSIIGIAKEIATLFNLPCKKPFYLSSSSLWQDELTTIPKIKHSSLECSGFLMIEVTNLKNIQSPEWLQTKLKNSGIIPQNNLLDYQTYILLETGYPFEFYDLDKIKAQIDQKTLTFSLTQNHKDKLFLANNSITYKLNEATLLLSVNSKPLSIAGLISQADYSYSTETTSLLIEGSIFDAGFIRRQGRALGLRTERSSRYEKSIKNVDLLKAFSKLIDLLRIQNPELKYTLTTVGNFLDLEPKIITLDLKTITEVLGPIKTQENGRSEYITVDLICAYFDQLNFEYTFDKSKQNWKVKIPELRVDDIEQPIDLVEEIGRLHGFDKFLTRLPSLKQQGIKDQGYKTRKKITSYFLACGLSELIHYSLVTNKEVIPSEVQILNPLMIESSFLRISLLPRLIKSVKENLKSGNEILEGFEYGHTFFRRHSDHAFTEKEFISGIFGGQKTKRNWSTVASSLTWFEAKWKIEKLFAQLRIITFWKPGVDSTYKQIFHPYRSAKIYLSTGEFLGVFGQINLILANKKNISSEVYLFELDFNLLSHQHNLNKIIIYQSFNTFPIITKDISFIINETVTFNRIRDILLKNGTYYLLDITLIDKYQDTSLISDNKVSLCLKTIFQSPIKTLETKTVDEIIKNLKNILILQFQAEMRT